MRTDPDLEESLARSRPSLHVLRRIGHFMRPYWRQGVAPVSIEAIWVILWAFGPHFFKIVIDDFIMPGVKALAMDPGGPFLRRWVWVGVGSIAALMILNSIVQSVLSAVQRLCMWRACQGAMSDMREWLFGHLQRLSMDFFDREKQGRIITRVDRDVENLEPLLAWVPLLVTHVFFAMAVVMGFLLSYNWRLCGIVAALAPFVVIAGYASERWGLPAYRRVRYAVSRMTGNLAENVTGVQVVQAFGREEENLRRFESLLEEYRGHQIAGAWVRAVTFPGMLVIFGLARAGVIAYSGYAIPRGNITVGEISAALVYIGMVYGPLMMIAHLYDHVLSSSASAERVVRLMDREPTVIDRPDAETMPRIRGDVSFDHVYFKYDDDPAAPWVLEDISFEAKAGQIIALVGPTGAGKTSVVNLVPRFYQPQLGTVRIDGIDISRVTQKSLHQQMGIVSQENFLFTGTVMDNLKYGRPETTDEEAIAAAKSLGSHAIIEKLSNGYQTDVRERGGAISHGERQLICFTRALIANPRILILDEATSAVDTSTEVIIQHALWKLMEGRTTIVVAHRLSTVRHADKILVIKDGRIVESGSHDELIARGGVYADMFEEFISEA